MPEAKDTLWRGDTNHENVKRTPLDFCMQSFSNRMIGVFSALGM